MSSRRVSYGLLAGCVGVLGACSFVVVPLIAALVIPIVASALFLIVITRATQPRGSDPGLNQWLLRTVFIVFAVRILVSLLIASSSELVSTFGPDAVTYHEGAASIVRHWDAGTAVTGVPIAAGKEGFFYLLAALYYVFGAYEVSGLIVNAALSAALLPILYDTTRRLFGRESARVAVIIAAVLPSFVVWTSQLLREAPALFMLALAANAAVRLAERATFASYGTLVGAITILFTLRANVALIAVAGMIVGLAFGRRGVFSGVAAGAATGGFVLALILAGGIGYAGFQAATGADLEQVSLARRDLAGSASSAFAPTQDVSTTQKAVTFLPTALPNFVFGPFPWQVGNVRQLGGALEAMSLWIFMPSLLRGLKRARRVAARRWYVLVGPAVMLTVSLSLLIGNFGTVVRERVQVTVLLIPIAAYGWTLRKRSPRSNVRPPRAQEFSAARV